MRVVHWMFVGVAGAALGTACAGGDEACEPELEIPYDGVDQDCDGADLTDVDGDGFEGSQVGGEDCNDGNADVSPEAEEIPYDGTDQDCSGTDLVDVDQDGYVAVEVDGDDCDDNDPDTFPGASDTVGDGSDKNCDGVDGFDGDDDGFASVKSGGTDCNDFNETIYPGADEIWYDDVDQNCDNGCDYDQDGDGHVIDTHTPVDDGPCDLNPKAGEVEFLRDCDDEDDRATDNYLLGTEPADGETEVFRQGPVIAFLTRAEKATLEVFDLNGNTIPGSAGFQGPDLVWDPNFPLAAETTYEAELLSSCQSIVFTFTTSIYGVPVEPKDLVGSVYGVDLSVGTWIQPFSVGPTMGLSIDRDLLLGVSAADSSQLSFVQATSGVGATSQDVCVPTVDIPNIDFVGNPRFTLGPVWLQGVLADGTPYTLAEAVLSGTLQGDGTAFGESRLTGVVDTRPFVASISGPDAPDTAICDDLAGLGRPCEPCPDKSGVYCAPLEVEGLSGTLYAKETVVPRTVDDVAMDATCP